MVVHISGNSRTNVEFHGITEALLANLIKSYENQLEIIVDNNSQYVHNLLKIVKKNEKRIRELENMLSDCKA